jgi:hypothetical protein
MGRISDAAYGNREARSEPGTATPDQRRDRDDVPPVNQRRRRRRVKPLAVERVPPGEAPAVASMIATLKTQLTKRYAANGELIRRDAHPKHHGLVDATFQVDIDRPIELRYGIFREAREFKARIRYSNSQPVVNHDLEADTRGCAIKLSDAPRSFFGTTEHDFILTTGEAFFGIDAVDFVDFPAASESGLKTLLYFLRPRRLRGFWNLIISQQRPRSPWNVEYFSQTPYRLGPHCVKYHVRPVSRRTNTNDPWYLRSGVRQAIGLFVQWFPGAKRIARFVPGFDAMAKALASDLSAKDARLELEFLVQRWPDLATMPVWAIEDPTRRWPWRWDKVATIRIAAQDSASTQRAGEVIAFNPWQVSAVHRPLGGINRARLAIYDTMSRFRNRHNR